MDHKFDIVAKAMATEQKRREALRWLGGIVGGLLLGTPLVAYGAKPPGTPGGGGGGGSANQACSNFCSRNSTSSRDRQQCMSTCLQCGGNTNRICGQFGAFVCAPSGATCCGASYCAAGIACCSGTCCASGKVCSSGICCNSGETGCGQTCCPSGQPCISGACGCPSGATLCNGTCCYGICNEGVCTTLDQILCTCSGGFGIYACYPNCLADSEANQDAFCASQCAFQSRGFVDAQCTLTSFQLC